MEFLQFQGQGTDTDNGSQLFSSLKTFHIVNLGFPASNRLIYAWGADSLPVIDNWQGFPYIVRSRLGKLFCPFICQGQLHHILAAAHIVVVCASLGIFNVRPCHKGLPSLILEFQGARLAKLLKNCIGVGNTRDFYINAVISLLVYRRLRTIGFHTLLQLIYRVLHILCRWVVLHRLVRDADAACKVQPQFNVTVLTYANR